jgi:hypothetical protein
VTSGASTSGREAPRRATARGALWIAVLAAGLTTAVAVRFNTLTPWGTDGAAYVEAAHRWAAARLFEPSPLPLTAPWTGEGAVTVPLGMRPGLISGTDISEYPPGFSILMAAALGLVGDLGPYLVAPLSAGVIVLCASVLGRYLAGPAAGLIAVVLVAASPATLVSAMQPMSDAPVTALWLLALVLGFRPGAWAAAAAGSAAGMAVLVRPNLAPLAAVIGLLILATGRATNGWRAALGAGAAFAGTTAVGVATLMWCQAVLYGGPFTPSYRSITGWFTWAHVPINAAIHTRNLVAVHSSWMAVALLAPLLFVRARPATPAERTSRRAAIAFSAVIALNVALYLPYTPYPEPQYLRFLLPAIVLAFVFIAAVTAWLLPRTARVSRWLTPVALVPALVVLCAPGALVRYPFGMHDEFWRVVPLGRYLENALPANAVAFVYLHGTATAHYTGAPTVRLDLIPPDALDRLALDLERRGFTPVFVADYNELPFIRTRFAGSPLGALDWPPRARSIHGTDLSYWLAADRARHARGERWETDVLRVAP